MKIKSLEAKSLSGIRITGDIPNEQIQILKNDIIKKQLPIPLIEKMDLKTFLFPDTPINFNRDDKIGIKLM